MRSIAFIVCIVLLMAGLTSCASAQSVDNDAGKQARTATERALKFAQARLQAEDLAGAMQAFGDVIASSGFKQMSDDIRYPVLEVSGRLALSQDNTARAHEWFTLGSDSSVAEAGIWHQRLSAGFDLRDFRDAALCIGTIAKRWPETLDQINHVAVHQIALALDAEPDSQREYVSLVDSLFRVGWTDDIGQPNGLWLDLVAARLRQGDVPGATQVAARIDSARVVQALRVGEQFAPVRAQLVSLDVERALAMELAQAGREVQAKPNLLEPLVRQQSVLLSALQFEQALAIGERVLQRVGDVTGKTVYADYDDEFRWILDNQAIALRRLGRWDEAVKLYVRAARHPESGHLNVSQTLNLGMLLAELDRGDEALDAVVDVDSLSDFGRAQMEMLRLLVALQRNDAVSRQKHLAYLREHRELTMPTYQMALLHTGDIEASAALLIERLQSDRWRADALAEMQVYPPVPETPCEQKAGTSWRKVTARADVRAVLRQVGRIERVNLVSPRY